MTARFNTLGFCLLSSILLGSAPTRAEEFPPFELACNERTNAPNLRTLGVVPTLGSAGNKLEDEAFAKRYLEHIAIEAFRRCKDVPMPDLFRGTKQSPISRLNVFSMEFVADYDYTTKKWLRISNNYATYAENRRRNEIARADAEQKRREESSARQMAAAERESARLQQIAAVKASQDAQRARFKADLKVDEFVEIKNLYANPFYYKNKRVAVVTHFRSMTAADTAMFGSELNPIFTTSTRVDRFRSPDEAVMLVFKFTDLTRGQKLDLGTSIGGMLLREAIGVQGQVVSGQYIGAYTCKSVDCSDFYAGT